ncbi:hypothetical protein GY45DRAFT_1247211 [Cubamyces sp. BRFM 1775]|nr:hypothetical protein GY45DRAFT_1247211 [Cubamyces sp. BRFM 1775]
MPRAPRSSLTDHCFPAFYACYLLKSVRTPRATATYIGSTPSPPRRIRQHNGEISQGAWKTKHNRPWIMQMIVHGFPSKLAALQFEWAWQHPHISRHLRDNDGNAMFTSSSGRFKHLNANVNMVSSHPYNTWPLSVTLFTEEAEKAWTKSGKDAAMPPLPSSLKVTTELEGVDGKSGKASNGRTGPIDVMDSHFTVEHLRKASAVLSPGSRLRCSICHENIAHDDNPLSTALCPANGCRAVSHLSCLSRRFLELQPSSSSDIIPRGGTCVDCQTYVLWGDIIRGCYRRHKGGATPEDEPEEVNDPDDVMSEPSCEEEEPEVSIPPKAVIPPRVKGPGKGRSPAATGAPSSTGAPSYMAGTQHVSRTQRGQFDIDVMSPSDEDESEDDLPWSRVHARPKPNSRQ